MQRIDYTGRTYGDLTAIKSVSHNPTVWLFRCVCGVEKEFRVTNIVNGNTRSCGCYRRVNSSQKAFVHGQSGYTRTAEYRAWDSMKQRCYNPKVEMYYLYGARGITVCDEWLHDFEAFFTDMGPRPTKNHSLDRRDNNGSYNVGNCRWATKSEQAFNRRPKGTTNAPC